MELNYNIKTTCRACMKVSKKLSSIYRDNIDEIYTNYTQIELNDDMKHKLSQLICDKCVNCLKKFDLFKRACLESDALQRKAVTDLQPPEIDIKMEEDVKKESIDPISLFYSKQETSDDHHSDCFEDAKSENDSETGEKSSVKTRRILIPERKKKCSASFRQQFFTDDGQYTCPDCKKAFLIYNSLRQHMRRHLRSFVCDICGDSLACQTSLRVHKMNRHADESISRRFSCDLCSNRYKNKAALIEHKNTTHTTERNYICDICSATFKSRKTVRKHIQIAHFRERKYKCEFCEFMTKTTSQLKAHTKTHLGIRNHTCTLCNRAFLQKVTLNKHIKTHKKLRPFQCKICFAMFTQVRNLKLHTAKQHPQQMDQLSVKKLPALSMVEVDGLLLHHAKETES